MISEPIRELEVRKERLYSEKKRKEEEEESANKHDVERRPNVQKLIGGFTLLAMFSIPIPIVVVGDSAFGVDLFHDSVAWLDLRIWEVRE